MSRPLPLRCPAPRRLIQWRLILTLFFCLAMALAPGLAEARAGRSFSFGGHSGVSGMGSRGSRTFEYNRGAPITRSVAPHATSPLSGMGYGYGGGFFSRHPFLTGLFGGFLGSMLFRGMGGFGHVFGGLLQLLIIGGLIWFLFRLFAGRGFSAGRSWAGAGGGMPGSVGAAAAPTERFRGVDTTVTDSDLEAFQAIHAAVQEAWSRGDLARMRQLMTPEMVGYFSEELTRNTSEGVRNVVSDVRLVRGEVSESWEEGDLQYATAFMEWSAIDYTTRLDGAPGQPGAVVDGDPRTPSEAEEMWTFVRRRGGNWLLSAIQQA